MASFWLPDVGRRPCAVAVGEEAGPARGVGVVSSTWMSLGGGGGVGDGGRGVGCLWAAEAEASKPVSRSRPLRLAGCGDAAFGAANGEESVGGITAAWRVEARWCCCPRRSWLWCRIAALCVCSFKFGCSGRKPLPALLAG
ncbi:hypothetical protein PVAP13_1NG135719 [Panicum virgatum]|uniref:Uncharacterized protein n=1 Tax=Panicum virgatum TaxID=38727 RepID=A0A8T0WZ41_PANVG|nr:hypothetical protein PVAP13_1NG135719 [Panicum virgatum]